NGNWAEWSSWSACSITCGNFSQSRTRTCTNPSPSPDGRPCLGESVQHQLCIFKPCPGINLLGTNVLIVFELSVSEIKCIAFIVDGGWSAWGAWGTCSATCGVGIKHRDRTCSNPTPSRFGNHCFGESRDDKICVLMSCTGGRSISKHHVLLRQIVFYFNMDHLPLLDGHWSNWGTWSSCPVTCGGGILHRERLCNHPAPSLFGRFCDGDNEQTKVCNINPCLVRSTNNFQTVYNLTTYHLTLLVANDTRDVLIADGAWSTWRSWSTCSASCGGGVQRRHRYCNNPAPSVMGHNCAGTDEQTNICNSFNCYAKGLLM
ncbi:HMCN1-like protein, partial [Mya arenaria]